MTTDIRKVHCFFEQSGTFKNEFIKLGIPAEDYDIQNNFGQTDHVCDLFDQIEKAFDGEPSIFDKIQKEDLVMAFFPCTYFEPIQMLEYTLQSLCMKNLDLATKYRRAIRRIGKREKFLVLLYKLVANIELRGGQLVVENPIQGVSYLTDIQTFLKQPDYIDKDRTRRGDYFKKPTAYWFFGREPKRGFTMQQIPENQIVRIFDKKESKCVGLCSEERSMISPDYARNFICDQILGITQPDIERTLFSEIGNN